jgi:hypothetical protein
MTPKEKAIELMDKFYQTTPNESWINQPIGLKKEYKAWEQSKQCALIAVDEMLNLEPPELSYLEPFSKSYWQEVKNEINQLTTKNK